MIKALIINYNSGEMIPRCLKSLVKFKIPVLVIDNNSSDGSRELVEKNFPDLELIKNDKNIGFARAVNQGIGRINEPYALIVNPDAELITGIDRILDFMTENKQVGIVGGLVLDPDYTRQSSVRGIPTLRNFPFGRTSTITRIFPDNPLSSSMLLPELDYQQPQKVPAVCGSFVFINKEAFEKIGGMDENFFLYVEDIDLCKRMWDNGREVWFHPGARCLHYYGESHRNNITKSRIHHLRSMIYFLQKHYQPSPMLSSILQIGAGLSAIYFLSWFRLKRKARWQ